MTGESLVQQFEGLSLTPYQDVAGNWTIGYGHKIVAGDPYWPVGPLKEITQAQAQAQLTTDMAAADQCVTASVTVPLNSNQKAALESFVFNVGCGAFQGSTLLQLLNEGNYSAVPGQLDRWVYAGSQVVADLVTRRAKEGQVFMA